MNDAVLDQPETLPVQVTVRGVEPVHGRGNLVGLAVVELDIAGVVLTLQGVRIVKGRDGALACLAPCFKHPRTSTSLPAALLPPDLADALGAEVLAEWRARP